MAVSNQPKHVNDQDLIVCSLYHKERGVKIRGIAVIVTNDRLRRAKVEFCDRHGPNTPTPSLDDHLILLDAPPRK